VKSRRSHADTAWYGFEIRASKPVDIFLAPMGGVLSKVVDTNVDTDEIPFVQTDEGRLLPLPGNLIFKPEFIYKFTVRKSDVDGGTLQVKSKAGDVIYERANLDLNALRLQHDPVGSEIVFDDYVFTVSVLGR
jgi:hypothetical protein